MNGPDAALVVAAPSWGIAAPRSAAHGEVTATAPKRLSVGEAVMELDMMGLRSRCSGMPGTGRIDLVYRRPDGHIGWIDPPAMNVAGGH